MAAASRRVAAVDVHEEPVDFDADALIAEAGRRPFMFRFAGQTWTLPPSPGILAVECLKNEDVVEAFTLLLGEDQWRALIERAGGDVDLFALKAIIDRYAEHVGLNSGNSSASTPPSKPTVAPSRRTSNGSTASR